MLRAQEERHVHLEAAVEDFIAKSLDPHNEKAGDEKAMTEDEWKQKAGVINRRVRRLLRQFRQGEEIQVDCGWDSDDDSGVEEDPEDFDNFMAESDADSASLLIDRIFSILHNHGRASEQRLDTLRASSDNLENMAEDYAKDALLEKESRAASLHNLPHKIGELPDDATAAEVELTVQGGDGGPNMLAELATTVVIDPMIDSMVEHAESLQV